MTVIRLLLLLLPLSLFAKDFSVPSKAWKVSLVPYFAGAAADTASSYGMCEINPLLRSEDARFREKGAVLKIGLTTMLPVAERYLIRKYPRLQKPFTVLNWGFGISWGALAARNYAVRGK